MRSNSTSAAPNTDETTATSTTTPTNVGNTSSNNAASNNTTETPNNTSNDILNSENPPTQNKGSIYQGEGKSTDTVDGASKNTDVNTQVNITSKEQSKSRRKPSLKDGLPRKARSLEKRWHQIYLRSLEWDYYLEGAIANFKVSDTNMLAFSLK